MWPQSLSGQLAIILVIGMLLAQMLTGTIWYDMRYGKALEMPTRLVAAKLGHSLRILDAADAGERDQLIAALSSTDFHLQLLAMPSTAMQSSDRSVTALAQLLQEVLQHETGKRLNIRMLDIHLDGDHEGEDELLTLLHTEYPSGHFRLQVQLPDGAWLQADAREGQAGMSMAPLSALFDYLGRIYLLRIAAIIVIALLAVRLVMRPLNRLARAAERLGANLHSEPLTESGPLEVRKAAQAFNAMQRRLIANIAERTRFLAAVSHDLRSPITRMKLRTEMLRQPEQQEKFRKDLDEMDALISATLNVVQDIEVHEEKQLIDIDSLLLSLQTDFSEIGAEITVHGKAAPLPAYGRSLKRCLQNLLDNAVRYGERADVSVQDDERQLRITISDHGPGIPEAMLEQVLEPFYRLEQSRNSSTGGFGLGLSIAQTIVLAHHGSLSLHNREQGGLEARIILLR
ncbi:HAMP domain protein [Janthinobacterium agaricidamnosum NBRC 102515 = DSM 9628]|uniref:histidine kinase n=1 Tax=Janthinobacterium agaricidamnosum NBRC 102515 = DSM 9628 TaxID=1349767 RepID=W0UZS3_9BURK|nr:HAMP domain protein [Janthinobacterium agaricidamnosum NBRC 102515 = DSM 9628]